MKRKQAVLDNRKFLEQRVYAGEDGRTGKGGFAS